MRRLLLLVMTAATALPAQQSAPLAQYTATKVAVVPVQFFKGDSTFATPTGLVLRAAFDSLLSDALEEHGLKGMWATPREVSRSAKRNPTYAGDPRNLGAFPVRGGVGKDGVIADPLASNLRRVVALHDARYVLMPVELHVDTGKDGGNLAVRLLLVDARLNQPVWQVDLLGARVASYSPALLEKLATRVAELAVAP